MCVSVRHTRVALLVCCVLPVPSVSVSVGLVSACSFCVFLCVVCSRSARLGPWDSVSLCVLFLSLSDVRLCPWSVLICVCENLFVFSVCVCLTLSHNTYRLSVIHSGHTFVLSQSVLYRLSMRQSTSDRSPISSHSTQ